MTIENPALLTELETASPAALDAAEFGLVRMKPDGTVLAYNTYEARLSGLSPEGVMGKNFFTQVAPCTNNFMVAERFQEPGALDALIDYVFTYKMKPTKVRLRLLKRADATEQYLAVAKL
ncbi:MAG: photoactive yellow protein [Burkholderiales bacterium]|nr:photoactive yellow protein [Opitutaceae bacterium]